MLLANCSYEESRKYNCKIVLASEDESNKKPEEVLLNIVTDDVEEVYSSGIGVAKCITTTTSPSRCPLDYHVKVFRVYNYSIDDLSLIEKEVKGVVPLIVLPEGFCDMREVLELMQKYPTARVTGGNLLEIPGVRIGRYDNGKEKMSAVFNGVYDIFKEVDLDSIKVHRVMSKAKSKSGKSSKSSSGTKKSAPKSKKIESFTKFFGNEGSAF